MSNTTWQDETVQSLKQGYEERITELNNELEKVSHGAVALAAKVARLTAHNESMQADAVNNTATIKMLMAQLAENAEEIKILKQALQVK